MPELSPFRALRYGAFVGDLSAVLCPPYDVINAAERQRLADRDPRNAVHVELPSSYESAATTFATWQAEGTLTRDDRPMIYVYEQRYADSVGSERSARGFFCRLRIEPYGPGSGVLPHEHTMSGPKEDRFQLMKAVSANLSPVLFLYDDGDGGASASRLVEEIMSSPPSAAGTGPGGLINRLWAVDPASSPAAADLVRIAGARPATIADGHHRYETALRYRDEVGGGSSDYVLALMYEAHSGGLALLPWHRVLAGADGGDLLSAAGDWFSVHPVGQSAELTNQLAPGSMGLWTRKGGALLRVDRNRVADLLPKGRSETLRWLDVSVLSATLSRMIGTQTEELAADGRLTYSPDAAHAIASVDSEQADAAFLVPPTPIEDVLAVAAAGEHMPAKSTFFHPKAATGLVFNTLAD